MLDKAQQREALLREWERLRKEYLPFIEPQSADNPRPWTEDQLRHFEDVHNRLELNRIAIEKLESGP